MPCVAFYSDGPLNDTTNEFVWKYWSILSIGSLRGVLLHITRLHVFEIIVKNRVKMHEFWQQHTLSKFGLKCVCERFCGTNTSKLRFKQKWSMRNDKFWNLLIAWVRENVCTVSYQTWVIFHKKKKNNSIFSWHHVRQVLIN